MMALSITGVILLYLTCVYIGNHSKYENAYWFFEFCHLACGFLVANFLSFFLATTTQIIMGTFIIGLLWEISEIIVDRSPSIKNRLAKMHIRPGPVTLPDTLLDLVLDIAGAAIFTKLLF